MPFVNSRSGVRIYFEESGIGKNCILFLHPWPTDHRVWLFQMNYFGSEFRAISIDFRGFGLSDKPRETYYVKSHTNDVLDICDSLGLDSVFLCGVSMGGIVSQQFAIDCPNRVKGAVFAGCPPSVHNLMVKVNGNTESIVSAYKRYLHKGGYIGFWNEVWKPGIDGLFGKQFRNSADGNQLIRFLFEEHYVRMNSDPFPLIAAVDGMANWNVERELPKLKMPILVLVGDSDHSKNYTKKINSICSEALFKEFPDSGHFCNIDRFQLFNETVRNFIKSIIAI